MSKMLSWKVAIILTLIFSLSSQMPKKHLLIETEDYAEEGKRWKSNVLFLSLVIPSFNAASIQVLMTVPKTPMVTAAGHILQRMAATPAAPAEDAQRWDAK